MGDCEGKPLLDAVAAFPFSGRQSRPVDLAVRCYNFRRLMINVTDKAVQQLRLLIADRAPNENKGLRVQIAKARMGVYVLYRRKPAA